MPAISCRHCVCLCRCFEPNSVRRAGTKPRSGCGRLRLFGIRTDVRFSPCRFCERSIPCVCRSIRVKPFLADCPWNMREILSVSSFARYRRWLIRLSETHRTDKFSYEFVRESTLRRNPRVSLSCVARQAECRRRQTIPRYHAESWFAKNPSCRRWGVFLRRHRLQCGKACVREQRIRCVCRRRRLFCRSGCRPPNTDIFRQERTAYRIATGRLLLHTPSHHLFYGRRNRWLLHAWQTAAMSWTTKMRWRAIVSS